MSGSELDSHFVPNDDDDANLWEVIEIIAEKGKRYRVRWAGIDPSTGRAWDPSWVPKHDCTDDLVRAWKKSKEKGKKSSATSTKTKPIATKTASGKGRKGKEKEKAQKKRMNEDLRSHDQESELTTELHTAETSTSRGPSESSRARSSSVKSVNKPTTRLKRKRSPSPAAASSGADEDEEPPPKLKIGPPRHAKKQRVIQSSQDAEKASSSRVLATKGAGSFSSSSQSDHHHHQRQADQRSASSKEDDKIGHHAAGSESVSGRRQKRDVRVEVVLDDEEEGHANMSRSQRRTQSTPKEMDKHISPHSLSTSSSSNSAESNGNIVPTRDAREALQLSPRTLDLTPDSVPDASSFWEEEPFVVVPVPRDDLELGEDSRNEIIPETQPSKEDDEDGEDVFLEGAYEEQEYHDQVEHSSPARTPDLQPVGSPSAPPEEDSPPLPSPPRSSTPGAAPPKTTHPRPQMNSHKPLRPVPVVTPSAFREYLPKRAPAKWSQETIEQFSSPERGPPRPMIPVNPAVSKVKKLSLHAGGRPNRTDINRVTDAHPPSPSNENHAGPLAHDSEAVVRTMEAEYIDMTGGFISPLNDSIETADSAAHTRQAQSIPESTLSSTQQAVVDSQSEIVLTQEPHPPPDWEVQMKELQTQLAENQSTMAALREDLRDRDEKLAQCRSRLESSEAQSEALLTEKQDAEQRAQAMGEELDELKLEYEALSRSRGKSGTSTEDDSDEGYSDSQSSPAEEVRLPRSELEKKLQASASRVSELEDLVQELKAKDHLAARKMYEARVQQLERELAQYRGLCTVLRQKDELTDDQIRRRAGEEPELRRKVQELETKITKLVVENERSVAEMDDMDEEIKKLVEEVEQYEREEAEWAKEKNIWLTEQDDLKAMSDALDSELKASRTELKESQSRCEELEKKAQVVDSELEASRKELADSRTRYDELYSAHIKHTEDLRVLQSEADGLRAEKELLQQKYDTLEREHGQLKEVTNTTKGEISQMKHQMVDLHAKLVRSIVDRRRVKDHLELLEKFKVTQMGAIEALRSPDPQAAWYVCREVVEGRECGERFESAQDLGVHARTIHYADSD